MKIDGLLIASEIKKVLKNRVTTLKNKNISPHLAVILVGHDAGSTMYVSRKQKTGRELGIKVSVFNFEDHISPQVLLDLINKLNADHSVHGIIIQRPVPIEIEKENLDRMVAPKKDVDGFHPDSLFTPPVASAVLKILEYVFAAIKSHGDFMRFLKKKRILLIGRGETAGNPIGETFHKLGINFTQAHSQTRNIKGLSLSADIIVSCVGKPDIVRQDMITRKSIVIGVGLHPENERLQPDYNQEEIGRKAAFYTPVPGGVGPVNVACLFDNLLKT
jgi:methylenetetrahydrofolate dehydrogenase (NADP+)/methenyltetrahydrofolate cyclohydrolase